MERRTNISSIETGKEEEMEIKVNSDRLMFWFKEFSVGRDARVL